MLAILHPSVMPVIQQMSVGILPLWLEDEEYPLFIVKVPKEYILAAKIREVLKIYLAPVLIDNQNTVGLVTAFFDDEDEPLVIRTPLYSDSSAVDLLKSLRNGRLRVHFFDELSREYLAYRANVTIPDETQHIIDEMVLLDFSFPIAQAMMDEIEAFFELRSSLDDAQAISVSLNEPLYGEHIFIQDLRPERHSYHGSRGYSHTALEREEPGSYQEEDIVQCLLLVFSPDQIFLSPKRIYDNEEICDVMVVTNSEVLIIQAKDSPNIERISRQKLPRKRKNILGALKKAVDQVKGAVGYYRRIAGRLEFSINGKQYSIDTKRREAKALIVVKELFNDQYCEYSLLLLDIFRGNAIQCIALDYPEFYQFCRHLPDEDAFFNAYNRVMAHAAKHGEYPRLRIGLDEG